MIRAPDPALAQSQSGFIRLRRNLGHSAAVAVGYYGEGGWRRRVLMVPRAGAWGPILPKAIPGVVENSPPGTGLSKWTVEEEVSPPDDLLPMKFDRSGSNFPAAYRKVFQGEDMGGVCQRLESLLSPCRLCPRRCEVDRLGGDKGFCGMGKELVVASFGPHFGEEPELVGRSGSGTIFFSGCNLGCLYCQNYDISHLRRGEEVTPRELALMMLSLQKRGCHNINLVTPTHFTPQIVRALDLALPEGLNLPLVYNCGGYESVETLKCLEGIVDIYMPDFKYGGSEAARKYSRAVDYPEVAQNALREMHRQVGVLKLEEGGLAYQGLLVRHLVLPDDLASSRNVLRFIAEEISPDTYVNIMAQYRPEYHACRYPELNRGITGAEFETVIRQARDLGLHRGFYY